MPHVFEVAPSGRAKCRGCDRAIAKGDLRFGERLPNPFGEGEMSLWFHPTCAAYRRPESLLEALPGAPPELADREGLERAAHASLAQRRIPRVNGAERSPSGQAKCRACHEPIERNAWRIRLIYYEEGRFSPGGFIHLGCRGAHFEGQDIWAPLLHFSPALSEEDRAELARAYRDTAAP